MPERGQIYACCPKGLMVEILVGDECSLACCGDPMDALTENTEDAAVEKHVPAVTRDGSKVKVVVGSVAHPMEEDHFIQFIEVSSPDGTCIQRRYLKPGEPPEAEFHVYRDTVIVREHCNLHGLWKAEG